MATMTRRAVTAERIYLRLRNFFIVQILMFMVLIVGMLVLLGNQQQTFKHITTTTSEVESSNARAVTQSKEAIKGAVAETKKEILSEVKDASTKLEAAKVKK